MPLADVTIMYKYKCMYFLAKLFFFWTKENIYVYDFMKMYRLTNELILMSVRLNCHCPSSQITLVLPALNNQV